MNIFEYSFLIKPLIVSLWLGILFALLGIFVLIKRMTFFSDGIAHSAVLGLAIAFLLNQDLLLFALMITILLSSLIYYLERKTKLHTDTLIGLIFVASLSLGLILMSQKPGYQPELLNFLIGNVLAISDFDLVLTIIFATLILLLLIFQFSKFIFVFLDPVEASLRKINVSLYEFIFYIILGISIILGIKIVGVVLATAFLVLPPAISTLISRSFKSLIIYSIFFSLTSILTGFFISTFYNFPLGASIVLSGSLIFFILFILNLIFKNVEK